MIKRGINLGCGHLIMPCEKPAHHGLLPDEIYAQDGSIEWDNVDHVPNGGVNIVCDLFDLPWRTQTGVVVSDIESNTYDIALAAHLVEHIPHAIKRRRAITDISGGWFAWWAELARVLKPGGVAYVLSPYAFSRGAVIDPTHTRYLIPETFGYFAPDENAPFTYDIGSRWKAVYGPVLGFTPLSTGATVHEKTVELYKYLNMVSEFALGLEVIK